MNFRTWSLLGEACGIGDYSTDLTSPSQSYVLLGPVVLWRIEAVISPGESFRVILTLLNSPGEPEGSWK
jgi:hypothetical protein